MKRTILRLVSLALILMLTLSAVCATQWWDPLVVERKVYTYLTEELKLNSAAACGILANIEYESAFQVTIVGDHGTSFGLCQWHAGRYTALRSYCMAQGLDYRTVEGQMAYLAYELKSTYMPLYSALRSVENTADGAYRAAYLWCIQFERPADMQKKAVTRGNSARYKYWNRYNSITIITPVVDTEPDPDELIEEITEEVPAITISPEPERHEQTSGGRRYIAPRPEKDRFPAYHGPRLKHIGSNRYTGFAVGMLYCLLSDGRKYGWQLPDPEESGEIPEEISKNDPVPFA